MSATKKLLEHNSDILREQYNHLDDSDYQYEQYLEGLELEKKLMLEEEGLRAMAEQMERETEEFEKQMIERYWQEEVVRNEVFGQHDWVL